MGTTAMPTGTGTAGSGYVYTLKQLAELAATARRPSLRRDALVIGPQEDAAEKGRDNQHSLTLKALWLSDRHFTRKILTIIESRPRCADAFFREPMFGRQIDRRCAGDDVNHMPSRENIGQVITAHASARTGILVSDATNPNPNIMRDATAD